MVNELLFLSHIILMLGALVGALLLGEHALVALIGLCGVLANMFVIKQIGLFGLEVTASDVYMIGSVLGVNLLQEFYSRRIARRAILISFLLMVLYLVLSQMHVAFVPSAHDMAHGHFRVLFASLPRIIISSVVVYLAVQRFDYYLYGVLRQLTRGRWFVARNMVTLTMSQGLDTVLFTFAALYGIVASVGAVMAFSFMIKMGIVLCAAPFIALARRLTQRFGLDVAIQPARIHLDGRSLGNTVTSKNDLDPAHPELVEGPERKDGMRM